MRRILLALLAAALSACCASGCGGGARDAGGTQAEEPPRDLLYQVSTLGALSRGILEGEVDYSHLRLHGDFGIGTFQGLDGEMVALDGRFYQIKTDGVPLPVSDSQSAPFAMVTFFDADMSASLPSGIDYASLRDVASGLLPSPNLFCAVRVEGEFSHMKIRSVPGQQPPYPSLAEVISRQEVWELENVRGSMVGFYCPPFLGEVNQGGFHLHFISDDLMHGGHVLDCRTGTATLIMDPTGELCLRLPGHSSFLQTDLRPGD